MNHLSRAREVFEVEIAALEAVKSRLDETFNAAVELVVATLQAGRKIVVVGIGKSGNVGQKIAATLTSTGAPSVVLNSVDALHGDLGIVSDRDLVIALSYTGESEELLRIVPALKHSGARILSFTGAPQSSLAKHSNVVLALKVPREACPFGLAPTSSTTAMLVMGDALAMSVLQARGFKKSDFARYHPSGAIGRALLLQVREIMRTGARNAVAPQHLTVKEALLIMTKARSGSVSVVDARGKLVGVFTDGDFRRHISTNEAVLSQALKTVMTPKPICISENALAVEALKIFNERNIDDLVVINARNQPVGLVDLQDLPKLKVI